MPNNRKQRRTEKAERRAFARQMIRALRAAGRRGPMRYNESGFYLSPDGTPDDAHYLGNAYYEAQRAPSTLRRQIVAAYAESFVAAQALRLPDTAEAARPHLLFDLVPVATIEEERLDAVIRQAGRATAPTYWRVGDYLAARFVFDHPQLKVNLDADRLETWGWSTEEAAHVAMTNLRARTAPAMTRSPAGYYASGWRDTYDPSRLLLPDVIRSATGISGELVAMLPHRNRLMVAPAADAQAVVGMASEAMRLFDEPGFITGYAYRADAQGRWAPFAIAPDHPAFDLLNLLRVDTDVRVSQRQHDHLVQLSVADPTHHHVSQLSPMCRPGLATATTVAFCTVGFPIVVPAGDMAALLEVDLARGVGLHHGFCDFQTLTSTFVDRFVPMGMEPEWFRLSQPLTRQEIASLPLVDADGSRQAEPVVELSFAPLQEVERARSAEPERPMDDAGDSRIGEGDEG